jgi:hypothetical protein
MESCRKPGRKSAPGFLHGAFTQARSSLRPPTSHPKPQEQRRNETRTHYLWKDLDESLEEVGERFRRMVNEGRVDENNDYIIFADNADRAVSAGQFPVLSLFLS